MNKATDIGMHFFVSGHVQGVFYRASACDEARRLGLRGWTRNLEDGRVECMACGTPHAIEQFGAWLRQGPPAAKVSHVEELSMTDTALLQSLPLPFEIRRS